jgi:ribonucleoside-diphosphate reductase alpha chain
MSEELSKIADKIHKQKYAKFLPNGKLESWEQTATRVSEYVARAEDKEDNYLQYLADFTKLICDRTFIPGGRVLANAGTGIRNLFNCFVMPIEDSRESIYDTLKKAAEIFAWGGGIGYNFSNIRAEGEPVRTTGGKASGPVSFMELFDTTGEVISQASRRGAQMGILNVTHPDIMKFIEHKNALNVRNKRIWKQIQDAFKNDPETNPHIIEQILSNNQLTHFNISIAIPDKFMDALFCENKEGLKIFDAIAKNAWESGDPGLYFIDKANEYNMVPYLGSLDATNPCGEVPLLPYEACCLGSINLYNFVDKKFIDWDYLEFVIKMAVRFLDDVQTLNYTPVTEINDACRKTRRLGLGVMGLANLLAEMKVPYDSEDALSISGELAKFIQTKAWEASMELAQEKGAFPAYNRDKMNWKLFENLGLEKKLIRNVAVTSIAPTGTIALLADVNGGIEPFFSKKYIRNITKGIGNIVEDAVTQNIEYDVKTSHDISWKSHVNMQSIWQKYTDNAVSKTINMSENSTIDDVKDAYFYAWEKNCKGITIYRNNSRNFQILNSV